MARSSVRSVRRRESADAAAFREMKAKAVALSSPTNQGEFRRGYNYVCKDVESGMTPDQSFDLASTPADQRSPAFMAGARAACSMLGGFPAFARKLASAYGVDLDKP